MDNRKRGSPLFSFCGRKGEEGTSLGGREVLHGEAEEDEDLFGDEDDELFSRISEDSCLIEEQPQPSTSYGVGRPSPHPRIENIKEEQPQPSTSYGVGRPSPSTHINSYGKVTPQARPLEKVPDFDEDAGKTWIYPINYPLRDYQFSMVENALFQNTLISLPTGLGKTFIAAVVMYNFYRWYPTCKVVFTAPTKPLVAQQVEACFNIMGIPQEDISQMTGSTFNPEKRIQEWQKKRVFFLTPQLLENDLSRGTCPAKLIRCLVLDEAHRAQGNHSFCQVVRGLREHGHDFRILALSATPGSDMGAVRQVLTNLSISLVELRNEDSADLQKYTFQRNIEKVVVPLGEELTNLNGRYLKILRMYVNQLIELKVLYTRDEKTLTKFQLLQSREAFRKNPPTTLPRSRLGAVEGLFALCMTLYHAYELMMQHGIRSFYRFLKETLSNEKSHFFARSELRNNGLFQSLMSDVSKKFEGVSGTAHSSKQDPSVLFSQVRSPQDSKMTPAAPFIISHPKMAKLLSIVLEHHQKFADEGKSTRIMIFSQYRDSVQEITEMLQRHHPLVKAMSFIGHGKVGQSGVGLTQKKQLQVVSKFRGGGYNTLVSTCVGEEGLDIGDVDLIICYDAPKSPVRLVQRMGRTGRKREGRIVILLTMGKEEQSYNSSQYQKKAISTALADPKKLARYLVPSSPRMVPRGLSPSCLKLHMKSDSWKTNARISKSSPKGQGSLSSLLSKTGSSSSSRKSSSGGALMSQEEWLWYRNIRVPWKEVKSVPPASLMCLDESKKEFDFEKHINLGSYQPWQSLPQTTYLVGHSAHSLHLVGLTEFIHLHQHFGPDEDPYGLEMAAFLDKAYVEDDDENDRLSPDFKTSPSKNPPVVPQENGKVKKLKKMQNSIGGKRKKTKNVQSSLIPDMFSRMVQSKTKFRKDNNLMASQSPSQNNAENDNMVVDNITNLLKNTNNNTEDDDVICLTDDDDDVNAVQSSSVIKGGSQDGRRKQSAGPIEVSERKRLDQIPPKKSPEERQASYKEVLYLPMPNGGSLSLDIKVPPQIPDLKSDEEVEEPDSPSEVLEFCNEWLTKNLKANGNETENNNASLHSRDMFESTMTENFCGARKVGRNSQVINNVNNFVGDDDFEQLQGNTSLFSMGEASPVIGKFSCTKGNNVGRTNGNENNTNGSPRCNKNVTGISDVDVSPVLGRSNTLQSSTPKTVSKCLFKGITPHLSTIDEFSPIPKNLHDAGASGNLFCPSTTMGKGKKENESHKNVGNPIDSQQSHRKRFRSKLSRFALPEEPEVDFIAEIAHSDKATGTYDSVLTSGSGKMFPKKLCYEDIPAKSDHPEVLTNESSSELNKVTDLTSSFRNISKCKDASSFLFEDLNKINISKNEEKLKLVERRQLDDYVSHSNASNSVKDSSQSCIVEGEDNLKIKETTSPQSEEQNQQSICTGVKVEPAKKNEVTHEATKGNASLTMEDCSLFARIDECELDSSKAAEKYEDSDSGLTVTQVLHFMNKSPYETQNASSNTTFSKPSLNFSKCMTGKIMPTPGHPSRKLSLSLSRKNREECKANKSDECVDIGIIDTSSTTFIGGSQRKSPNKTPLNLPSKSNCLSLKQTTEPRAANEGSKEKHVSFCTQENEEFDVSESFLADVDFELAEMPETHDVETRNAGNVNKSSSILQSLAEGFCQGNRSLEKGEDQSSIKLSRSKQDSGSESSKLLSPTQETQLLIKRKRKVYNVVESDQEESFASSDTDKDACKNTSVSDNSRASAESSCVTAPLRKAVAEHLKNEFDDDDDWDFVGGLGPHHPIEKKTAKEKRKKKKKRFGYLDDEAEVSMDTRNVSSDESEAEEVDYDRSFVDDGTYLSQDNQQDMEAIYLRSVTSPMRPNVNLNHRPPLKYIHDSLDTEAEGDEELGSFVVDNSFVEYETEYAGETMLAEDPIIQQALEDQRTTKKTKDATNGNKAKRKRIVLHESSSDEDTEEDCKVLKQTSAKKICMVNPQPLHPDKNLHSEKNVGSVVNKNVPSCSKVDPSDSEDFEIIEVKPIPPKLQDKPNKVSSGKLPVNSNREQKFPANPVRSQTLSHHEMSSSSSSVKNITVVNGQQQPQSQGRGGDKHEEASSGAPSRLISPVQHKSSEPLKDESRKCHGEGLDTSPNSSKLSRPTTSPVGGSQASTSVSSQLNTSSSFFISSVPFNKSLSNSQTVPESAPQEDVGVLVDSSEVQSGGNLLSQLRLRYGAKTAVVTLKHAHYAVSTRMAVARLPLAVFSSSQHRKKLVERVQGMLELYERPVIIVETEAARGSSTPHQTLGASLYLDTIVCAFTQVTRLKLLYSKGPEETSHLLWQLLLQEKAKGFKIATEAPMNAKRRQMVTFYLTLPSIGYPTAVAFAQNFITIKEFLQSSPECLMKKGSISIQKATALKQHTSRPFREDMLVT